VLKTLAGTVLIIISIGCARAPASRGDPKPEIATDPADLKRLDHLEKDVATIAVRINSLTEDLANLAHQVSQLGSIATLENHVSSLSARIDDFQSAYASVTTEEETYGVARTPFGPFVVLSEAVTPYLDGYKITLNIGNLTMASFHGAMIKVRWGGRKREVEVTTIFTPGRFSTCEVALTPARAEEIKVIAVGIELRQLSMPKE